LRAHPRNLAGLWLRCGFRSCQSSKNECFSRCFHGAAADRFRRCAKATIYGRKLPLCSLIALGKWLSRRTLKPAPALPSASATQEGRTHPIVSGTGARCKPQSVTSVETFPVWTSVVPGEPLSSRQLATAEAFTGRRNDPLLTLLKQGTVSTVPSRAPEEMRLQALKRNRRRREPS
jgi:hypothetical protein